jgi:phage terminase small subunit
MTDRQWAFCRRYVKQGFVNIAGAYRHAYPNCKSDPAAESASSRLLRTVKVSAYLAEVKNKAAERTQITADRVLKELSKVGFAAVAEEDIRASDKVSALEKIGKHYGMFTERRADEHGGEPSEGMTPERVAAPSSFS